MSKWGGRAAQRYREQVFAAYGRKCHLRFPDRCLDDADQADHVIPRSVRPDLEFVVSNGRPACGPCNRHKSAKSASAPSRVDERARFFESRRHPLKDSAASPPQVPTKIPEDER